MKLHKPIMALTAICGLFSTSFADIKGTWNGTLQVTPQVKMRLAFHIPDPQSKPHVITMDSPDQGAYGIEAEVSHLSNDSVSFSIPRIGMSYTGRIRNNILTGTFRQGGLSIPLELTPGEVVRNRPQTPQPPFPYTTEDIRITNPECKDVTLAATLTLPENADRKTPLVVMVSGSGLQNRDEELFGHKPFAVIADYLARNGIASLRYDDRGFAESTGDPATATTYDNASDAAAAISHARSGKRFSKVGILGHSEGGMIAFILGARKNAPDFIVTMGAPAVRADSILLYQNRRVMEKSGMPQDMTDEYIEALGKLLQYKIDNPGKKITSDEMEIFCTGWGAKPVYKELSEALMKNFSEPKPWIDTFIAINPQETLGKTKVPMLLLYGAKDTQVPPSLNETPARRLAPEADIRVYPDLNHPMQHAKTGDLTEYAEIEETISPEVLSDIAGFIKSL